MEVKKIIIRESGISTKEFESRFWMEYERELETTNDFFRKYSFPKFMKSLFNEEVDAQRLEETSLFKSYLEVINTGKENKDFHFAYLLKYDLAAYISHHLYLTQVSNILEINGVPIFPWHYGGPKWYVCDTWGEKDDEIITCLRTLPYVDFLKRYRAY